MVIKKICLTKICFSSAATVNLEHLHLSILLSSIITLFCPFKLCCVLLGLKYPNGEHSKCDTLYTVIPKFYKYTSYKFCFSSVQLELYVIWFVNKKILVSPIRIQANLSPSSGLCFVYKTNQTAHYLIDLASAKQTLHTFVPMTQKFSF